MSVPTRLRPRPATVPARTPGSPAATRSSAVRWRDPRLVVGLALVAVSGLLGATVLGAEVEPDKVWTAGRALSAGQTLSEADLVRREVGFADQAAAGRYLSAAEAVPAGTVLSRDVGVGELVPRAALGGGGPRLVEVPLTVTSESVPVTVREGSVVDVWVTADPDLGPAEAQDDASLVLASVQVLAVSRGGGALGPSPTRQVIVGLDADQQQALPSALAELARGSAVLVRTS